MHTEQWKQWQLWFCVFFFCCLRPDTRLRLRSKAWTLFHTHENWILLQWFWKLLSTQKMEKCNVCTAKIHFYACIQAGAERGKTKKKRKPAKEWNVWVWILFFICMKFSHVARWQSIIWASVIFCPFIFANCYYRVFTHSCLAQQMRDAPLNHVCWVIFGSIIRPACGCVWNEECLPWMQFHITIRKILERQTEELNASQGMRSLPCATHQWPFESLQSEEEVVQSNVTTAYGGSITEKKN